MSLVKFRAQNHPQQPTKDSVDDRGTDPALFADVSGRVGGFTLDVAAAAHNAKTERYLDREVDGLSVSWAGESVWCNPPYSNIRPWVAKAWLEMPACPIIVMLLPANRTEQAWWQDYVEPFRDRGQGLRVEFLRGRRRFVRANQAEIGPNERPPFGVCLLTWSNA